MRARFCFLPMMTMFAFQLSGQDSTMLVYGRSGLVVDSVNAIQNVQHLDDFFEALFQLKNTSNGVVNIMHVGDSHIQADFLTKAIRNDFQNYFGNAGRGLIVPGRVAGTNEPFNIHTASRQRWEVKRIVYPADPMPIGIGGITIRNGSPGSQLEIFMNDLWKDYSFNSIGFFHAKDGASFQWQVTDTTGRLLANSRDKLDTARNFSLINLPTITEHVIIRSIKDDSIQNHLTIFGLNLANGKPGVLYHAIGVNGAKYGHYRAATLFFEQTHLLNPLLIIVALGTNEALDHPYLDKKFFSHVDEVISRLRSENPLAKFVIVTPSDGFIHKTRKNPGLQKIREQLIAYAVENGLAFYDLYNALGGDDSALKWQQVGLMRTDGIHFTRSGYELIGHKMFEAFINGYNNYVSVRHP